MRLYLVEYLLLYAVKL